MHSHVHIYTHIHTCTHTHRNNQKYKYDLFICVDDSTIRESVLWLQNNLSPWQLVESHWKSTLAYRRNEIQSSQNKSIAEILSQWPVLKHPTAYTLIDEDFRFLNLTADNCINNWFQFFSKIQEVCPLKDDKVINELRSVIETDNLKDGTFTKI